jgi:hypothetical protein
MLLHASDLDIPDSQLLSSNVDNVTCYALAGGICEYGYMLTALFVVNNYMSADTIAWMSSIMRAEQS